MDGKSNPRTQSVKDAMLAEIIVTELSKFTSSHEQIMESTQKILDTYNDIGVMIGHMDQRDQAIAQGIKDLQLSAGQYQYLTKLSMSIARELKELDRRGVGIEPGALDKITRAVEQGNKPLQKQLRWITYGMIAAFVILLVMVLYCFNC
ncbi:hypothetical protein [Sunxiuqinia indica]|uniref:hypothetical protein n=1 Tax=Sunxiuqinia indica TaxID=2692584 RepID=UPI00135B7E59|nr:hypothetical protein [Sunxiuqinia indica]